MQKAETGPAQMHSQLPLATKTKKPIRLLMEIGLSTQKLAGSAIIGNTPLDPKLCVPAFRRVCPFQFGIFERTNGRCFLRRSNHSIGKIFRCFSLFFHFFGIFYLKMPHPGVLLGRMRRSGAHSVERTLYIRLPGIGRTT